MTIFLPTLLFGQVENITPDSKTAESFANLKDGVIKNEIAYFNIEGNFRTEADSFLKTKLNEISFTNCTDSSITFLKGGLIVSIYSTKFDPNRSKLSYDSSTNKFLTHIDDKPFWGTDGNIPKEKIKSIRFINEKYQLILPDSAISGLYEPNFCHIDKVTRKIESPYCKVFRSLDKKRIYIYMLNSDGAGGYEVTWVIQDSKYYTRIVDYGF